MFRKADAVFVTERDFQATDGMQEFPNPQLGETDARACEAVGDSQPGLAYLISCKERQHFCNRALGSVTVREPRPRLIHNVHIFP